LYLYRDIQGPEKMQTFQFQDEGRNAGFSIKSKRIRIEYFFSIKGLIKIQTENMNLSKILA